MMSNVYARTARFFVDNTQLSLLLIVSLFLAGLFAFVVTPKQYNPEIPMPAFRIVTQYPGATAEEVETLVTSEIENTVAEIPGVDETFSQSLPGASMVTVLFRVGESLEESTMKLYDIMYSNMHLAPVGVHQPLIMQIDPENVPILTLAITSDVFSQNGLRLFAFDLRKRLQDVAGVTNIFVTGGEPQQIRIEPDPERLAARGIAIGDILATVGGNNLRAAAGRLEGDSLYVPVELDGTVTSADQLRELIVRREGDTIVRLHDVATLTEGYALGESITRFREKDVAEVPAVFLSLAKRAGDNSVTVASAVHERLAALEESFVPEGIRIQTVRDEGRTAREEINGLTSNLITSLLIVALLLVAFLQWRAAAVVALAVPLTFAIVLIAGWIAGQTINRITLFALILSLGLLVDSAIVIVENITRHLGRDPSARVRATSDAVGEVGIGLLLSTLTSVIVFLPMSAVTGMMGAYMGPIAFFVPAALIASLLIAVTLSPYLASVFMTGKEISSTSFLRRSMVSLEEWYGAFLRRILLRRSLQKRLMIGALVVTLITFSFPILGVIRFRMLPKADKEQFYVYIDAPEQTPLTETDSFARLMEEVLLADPNILSVQTTVGTPPVTDFNGLFKGADQRMLPSQATIKANVRHPDDRWQSSESIVRRIRSSVQQALRFDPDVRVRLIEDPPGPPVLATLLARVKGPDDAVRESIARDLLALFRATDGVVDFDSTLPAGSPQKLLVIDHDKVSHAGLAVDDVAMTLQAAIGGVPAGIAHLNAPERTQILVRFAPDARDEPSDLDRITLRNPAGAIISLGSLVRVDDTPASSSIWHDERARTTMVFGEPATRPVVYAVKDLFRSLLFYRLPNGKGERVSASLFGITYRDTQSRELYRIEWGGEFEMTLENFRDLGLAMIVAFFLVYGLLVAQFRSFRIPLLVMSSIMLAFSGVIAGFAVLNLFGVFFSATSMIGMIALGGIVVNNAIILLEFIREREAAGLPLQDAIADAGQTRLRPILLTTLTTVLGSLTIVGDPVWSGLAWSIVFGLTISTVLTLVFFPILYIQFMSRT